MDTNNNNNNKQCSCNKAKVVNDLLKRISNLEFEVEDKQREIERLNKQLQLISDEFLKYDWENSSKEQIIFQLKNLYNFIFKGSDNK